MTKVFDGYAAYYDLLYRDKDYTAEAKFVQRLLQKRGMDNGDILELGCGTGKHAHQFARMGYQIHGIDLSPTMVKAANSKLPLELKELVCFGEGDVRSVQIGRKFNAVISLFHVASYQTSNDDISSMFKTAALHLDAGGIFIFDFWYGPAVLSDKPATRVKSMGNDEINVTRIAEPVMFPNENLVDVNYTVFISPKGDNQTQTIKESHHMRYFFAPELRLLLENSGFELISLVEWITGDEPSFDSWSSTVVAVRSAGK